MATFKDVIGDNATSRAKRTVKMVLDHVEIHPAKNERGEPVKGGGHTVHTVHRESGEEYGRRRTKETPFSAGEHEKMLAHVANELTLPEPGAEEKEQDGKGKKGAAADEDEGDGAQPAYE